MSKDIKSVWSIPEPGWQDRVNKIKSAPERIKKLKEDIAKQDRTNLPKIQPLKGK